MLHHGLLDKLQKLLPYYSSAQENYNEILQKVLQLRVLCYNHGLIPGKLTTFNKILLVKIF